MKIDRLLGIVLLLLNRQKMTAPELAARFEVSVRTIYRDIEAIDAAGIPIVSHQGVGGGFCIMDSYKLDRQVLTPDEMLSMLAALKGIGTALGDRRVLNSKEKIESLMPRGDLSRLTDELRIEFLPWGHQQRQDLLLQSVQRALAERRLIRFTYFNSRGDQLARIVEPMTLVFRGSAWYLYGYCRLKEDYRLFKISRIRELTEETTVFERRDKSYDEFADRSERRTEAVMADIVLRFSPAVRFSAEDFFDPESVEVLEDGHVLVRTALPESEWVYGMIMSYQENVEVVSPRRVREIVRDKALRLAEQHGDCKKKSIK